MNKISISQLNPITDDEVAATVSRQTKNELAEYITMTSPESAPEAGRSPWRRRLLVGLPLAAAVTATAVVVLSSGGVGPQRAEAAALSFQHEGDYLVVKVKDPVADPARYRKEFADRGLDIDLQLQAANPNKAGAVLFLEDGDDPAGRIETVEGPCGTVVCGIAVKVPVNYKLHARIVFGRTAKPGEMYETGEGDKPGEGIGLPNIHGRQVSEVVAILKARNVKIEYRYEYRGTDKPYPNGIPADRVQPNWYVHNGVPGTEGQIILFVGPEPRG
ncbi:hypothetical protein [Streptosporangium sp. CA-115845]|uniref:hypothetical protein n=1 Tax=Streptosporangium sp. CA-115845 TaxID=3240071 RepID=UPI003D905170